MRYIGSIIRGPDPIWQAEYTFLAQGMICPAPRWMASAWRVTSSMLNRQPRRTSSQITPPPVALVKADTQWSLISLRNWTPLDTSQRMLALASGGQPKHQIFLAALTSQLNSSASLRARSLA